MGWPRLSVIVFTLSIASVASADSLKPAVAILGHWQITGTGTRSDTYVTRLKGGEAEDYEVSPAHDDLFPGSHWNLTVDKDGSLTGTWHDGHTDLQGKVWAGEPRPLQITLSDDRKTATALYVGSDGEQHTAKLRRAKKR